MVVPGQMAAWAVLEAVVAIEWAREGLAMLAGRAMKPQKCLVQIE